MTLFGVTMILPPWAKPGMTIIKTWECPFNSGDAAYGTAKFVEYEDRQGNIQCCMMYVKWQQQYRGENYGRC